MNSPLERNRASAGVALFVALSFLGSWFVAATLRVFDLSVTAESVGARLFLCTLLYALTMGWQPIVATWVVRRWIDPPDRLDLGLRPGRPVFSLVGGLGAIALAASAMVVASMLVTLGLLSAEAQVEEPSSLSALGAFVLAVPLIWVQAFAEEVGWRGYFLPRAMERFGRWEGLVLHGAVWGLWYAPVLFFTSYGRLDSLGAVEKSLGFIVTCVLLGTLFGWLRLVSKSLVPVVLANTTLTLAAGLPYVMNGVDAGLRSAAFGPPGWVVLVLAIAGLLFSKWKHAVQVPLHPQVWIARSSEKTLH
jgi:membrane protease YdiL (CAAX protease family)